LPTVDAPKAAEPAASPVNEPGKASAKKKSVTIGQPEASQGDAATNAPSPRIE
jgi:hypothetical protein